MKFLISILTLAYSSLLLAGGGTLAPTVEESTTHVCKLIQFPGYMKTGTAANLEISKVRVFGSGVNKKFARLSFSKITPVPGQALSGVYGFINLPSLSLVPAKDIAPASWLENEDDFLEFHVDTEVEYGFIDKKTFTVDSRALNIAGTYTCKLSH